jgi:hypothetical protein
LWKPRRTASHPTSVLYFGYVTVAGQRLRFRVVANRNSGGNDFEPDLVILSSATPEPDPGDKLPSPESDGEAS